MTSIGNIIPLPAPDPNRKLAALSLDTSKENPWPLHVLSGKMKDYIDKMPEVWIEAEVSKISDRGPTRYAFVDLKDLFDGSTITAKCLGNILRAAGPEMRVGAHIILHVKPDFYASSGSLNLSASEIYPVGTGNAFIAIERLREQLNKEGLFSASHRKPLPFLPKRIGLICGKDARAKDDVMVNARDRWPAADFEIREVNVQGPYCPSDVLQALQELDANPDIEVIVITRGGGSPEDLIGFSDEQLVRGVFAAKTPIVSAIGHEADSPLMDHVADYRASTPTDAGKRIVPDWNDLNHTLADLTQRLHGNIRRRIEVLRSGLDAARSRPVMLNPLTIVDVKQQQQTKLTADLRSRITAILGTESTQLAKIAGSLRALSPQDTLKRGYAVVRMPNKKVITSAEEVKKGDLIEAILATGSLVATVSGSNKGEQK